MISILIPVYRAEKFIEPCARSLFEQSYGNIEYIFVDDCSSDNSIKKLQEILFLYPQRKPNVKIIRHKGNRGLSAARNTAVLNCRGDFVLHVDSDDYIPVDAVEKLVTKQQETGADIVTGQAIRLYKDKQYVIERPQFKNHDDFVKDMIIPSIHHTLWGRLIRRSLYIDNGIQAKEGVNIGEDMQVMVQLAYYAKKVESIWDIVYYYDCTNESSYMNQFGMNNLYRLRQDTASMEVVRDFLTGKSEQFQNLAEQHLYSYYWRILNKLGKSISRDEFYYVMERIYRLQPDNRPMGTRQRIKTSNYFTYILYKLLCN